MSITWVALFLTIFWLVDSFLSFNIFITREASTHQTHKQKELWKSAKQLNFSWKTNQEKFNVRPSQWTSKSNSLEHIRKASWSLMRHKSSRILMWSIMILSLVEPTAGLLKLSELSSGNWFNRSLLTYAPVNVLLWIYSQGRSLNRQQRVINTYVFWMRPPCPGHVQGAYNPASTGHTQMPGQESVQTPITGGGRGNYTMIRCRRARPHVRYDSMCMRAKQ